MAVLKLTLPCLNPENWDRGGELARLCVRVPRTWPFEEVQAMYPTANMAVSVSQLVWQELLELYPIFFPGQGLFQGFLQLEPYAASDSSEFHLHLVWLPLKQTPKEAGHFFKNWRHAMGRHLKGQVFPANWDVRKTAQGKWYRGHDSFIPEYLLPKLPPKECLWAWTTLERFSSICLDFEARRLGRPAIPLPGPSSETAASEAGEAPMVGGKAAARFLELIDWLVREGICSEIEWIKRDKVSYRTFMASSGGVLQVKNALQAAVRELTIDNHLLDFLCRGAAEDDQCEAVQLLFESNGYHWDTVAWYIAGWASGVWPKRRALWLHGPPNTGKTVVATSIVDRAPSFGSVAWTNENFTFNDCVCVPLIWWEEGRITEKIVEAAKCVLGGSPVRIDRKNRGSDEFVPAPVLITSNGDMTITYDGPIISKQHQAALRSRMTRIWLTNPLSGDQVGSIKAQWPAFMARGKQLLSRKGAPPPVDDIPRELDSCFAAAVVDAEPPAICLSATRSQLLVSEEKATWSSEDELFPRDLRTPPKKRRRSAGVVPPTPVPSPEKEASRYVWTVTPRVIRSLEWADEWKYSVHRSLNLAGPSSYFKALHAVRQHSTRSCSVRLVEAALCRAANDFISW